MNNIISSPFQMERNRVVSFSITQNENIQYFESANVNLGVDYKISGDKKNGNNISANLNLIIGLTGTTDKNEKIFEIKLDMLGVFKCDIQQIKDEKFYEMLKINGLSTLMQLSRAYITSSTALSGFTQPINFPMVNIYELIKMKEKKETKERNEI